MNFPKELHYVKSHEWVKKEGGTVTIGISDYAQDALGDLVFVNLPEPGDEVTAGEPFADVESVKAVSDIFSPVTGVICEVNEELLDHPELINHSPYDAWFIKVEQVTEEEEYLDAEAYEAFTAEEAEE
ncbi:MAG: glycine cleavage system protein GcvH [Eubacteriales bacterium]|nr:glycine cleavage system protein GcvH [Eubacteriales bacterium]